MRNLPAIVFALLITSSAFAEDVEPFEHMRKTLDEAETVQVTTTTRMQLPDSTAEFESTLALANGDRVRLGIRGKAGDEAMNYTMVSDGQRSVMSMNDQHQPAGEVKQDLEERTRAALVRMGVATAAFTVVTVPADEANKRFDADREMELGDMKRLEQPQDVGGRSCDVVTYTLTAYGQPPVKNVTVWIDRETHLPLKREVVMPQREGELRVTETYRDWKLDDAIPDERFEVAE